MYAIVEAAGKQYRVSPGQTIDVDRLPVSSGSINLDKVHLVVDGDRVMLGKPLIDGARVVADVIAEGKKDKVIVFKYKPKVRYRRKKGHRQHYTRLSIKEIVAGKAEE